MSSRDTNGGALPTKKLASLERGEEDDSPPSSKRDSQKAREDSESDSETERKHKSSLRRKSRRDSSDSEDEKSRRRKRKSRRRYSSDESSDSGSDSEEGESESSGSEYSDSESESEGERRERKRREKRRRREKEEERERRKRKREKEKKRRKKEKEEERRKKEKRKMKKKEKKERGKKGAVTNLWGKYGVIRETDMWTKRPEFTAWLAEVKQVNISTIFQILVCRFMEDHNTATFPSKKYYNLDAYYRRQMEKDMKKGIKKVRASERTVFNDEEQRRQELLQAREKHKEEQVIALKHSMQSGMAQAMKEQAQLREEMAYQYKLGNFEAAAAIQRRLDPDAAL
ncbi:uncharacterized protein LOC130943873 [Arachis stenosperma]|uniref:uncharacterized protein LOC130943873 n=1 Tax=Arachis stenosperma TaxID=217475 RepID=UPI0025ACD376|nr:uncharacterized protein LOC130943873 [Arachis stenosperma]